MSTPWLKFYPTDWRADPALRMCSLAARGLWMEMLCIMHEASPYGSLRVNGRPVTERQLSSLAGGEVGDLLTELEDAGVFSREADGTIFSRRMQRDAEKTAKDKANGRKGGNPALIEGVNPPDNGLDKAQKPEAIYPDNYTAETRAGAIDVRMPELCAALGVTDETKTPGLLSFSEPIQWVTAGCDIDADILPALRTIAARGKAPKSWRYCSDAVFEARDRRLAPPPAVRERGGTGPPRNDLDRMNAALDSLISGQPNEPDIHSRTIDASFERRDWRGPESAVQRPAIPARN